MEAGGVGFKSLPPHYTVTIQLQASYDRPIHIRLFVHYIPGSGGPMDVSCLMDRGTAPFQKGRGEMDLLTSG